MNTLNEEKITVSVTLYGEYARKLLEACAKSKRSRRSEVLIRLEDSLDKHPDFVATTLPKL